MTLEIGNERGFTLIEALVCLFLTVCLIWGTLPAFRQHQKEREIKLVCAKIQQTLSLARQMAIRDRNNFEVVIGDGGDSLRVRRSGDNKEFGEEERLPDGIIISQVSESLNSLIFRPDGGLAGVSGSLTVRDKRTGMEKRMIVYNLTGKVRIVK